MSRVNRRRGPGYAGVAATLALFVALGGTAWAAHHWLLTSTKQIKPSVLRKLRGATGPPGAPGSTGPGGSTGATGSTGANLTAETILPSGASESGVVGGNADGTNPDFIVGQIQYTEPLASPISSSKIIWVTSITPNANCPGPGHAAAGYLCLYDLGGDSEESYYAPAGADFNLPSPDPGTFVLWQSSGNDAYVFATWTVTAP
jgi:hypothetical protein